MQRLKGLFIFIVLLFQFCSNNNQKYIDFSRSVIDVSSKIVPLETKILFGKCEIQIVGDFIIINDWQSSEEGFHLFDKKTFKYIVSTGKKGQGPGEIINYHNARLIPNTIDNNSFFVFDYSRLVLYRYDIDSILYNSKSLPEKMLDMNIERVVGDIDLLNDSTFIGISSKMTNSHTFIDEIVSFDLKKRKIQKFGYANPQILELGAKDTHSVFALSPKKDKYVQGYRYQDLLTICDDKGNLIRNIYGTLWKGEKNKDKSFYQNVRITKNRIIASYVGGSGFIIGENERIRGTFPKKILIFDLDGNYLKTLNIGEEIRGFCVDEEGNRLIINFLNRDNPMAYIDLKGIVD